MELRSAACRGATYGTDQSAIAHGPHGFFPHKWAEPGQCPGWTEAESDAENLVRRLLQADRTMPGLALRWHPAAECSVQRVIIPGYAEFVSGLPSFPLQEIAGIPVTRDAAAEPGAWELASGENPVASGTVRRA